MTNKEHVLLLYRAIASGDCRVWNNWRIDHPEFLPQLSAVELWNLNTPLLNLSRSTLIGANFSNARLYRANLECSDLRLANLKNANLREANLQNANLLRANLEGADLRKANLSGADLRKARLSGALLSDANLTDTIFDSDAHMELKWSREAYVSRLERIALQLSSIFGK
jgi:hypothetical protein